MFQFTRVVRSEYSAGETIHFHEEVKFMGKWFKVPCETCDETGKICQDCGGEGTLDCDCDSDDECDMCGGSGSYDCPACVDCSACDGKGYNEVYVDECHECGGVRTVECDCTGGSGKKAADDDCYACGGDGEHTCPACRGNGYDLNDLEEHGIDPSLI